MKVHIRSIRIKKVRAFTTAHLLLFFLLFISLNVEAASITGLVMDKETGEPIANATATVSYSENATIVTSTLTNSTGHFQVTGLSSGFYTIMIEAEGYQVDTQEFFINESSTNDSYPYFGNLAEDRDSGGTSEEYSFHLTPLPEDSGEGKLFDDEPRSERNLFSMLYQAGIISIIVLVLTIVMYSKIKRENLLKNAIRSRIYDYIKDNPGKHYRAILSDLELPMGVLSYHLNRLEKGQYIRSRQDGHYRRFYSKGFKTEMQFFLSDVQESIISVIKENQGVSQTKIADEIGVSRKVVNYHVGILKKAGIIFIETNGRESSCYFVEPKSTA